MFIDMYAFPGMAVFVYIYPYMYYIPLGIITNVAYVSENPELGKHFVLIA